MSNSTAVGARVRLGPVSRRATADQPVPEPKVPECDSRLE